MKIFKIIIIVLLFCLSTAQAHASVSLSAAIGATVIKKFKTGKLKINKIIVEQPHIFKEDELKTLLAKYEGREITVDELKGVQSTLSKYYFETGYVNSGVIIPEQSVEGGVIKFKAVHGRLSRVKITGNKDVSNKYIYSKIRKGMTVPLNLQDLQQSLFSLRQDPLIDDVKANLKPGGKLGQSILELEVKESDPYYLNAEFNNHKSVSIGQYGVSLYGGHRNLFGMQDNLQADFSVTEGLKDIGLNYVLPTGIKGIIFSANYGYSDFAVVDPVFAKADVEGTTKIYGAKLSYSLIESSQFDLAAYAGINVNKMVYSLPGLSREEFASPLIAGAEAVMRQPRFASAISAGVRQGVQLGIFNDESELQSFRVGVGQVYMAYRPLGRVEIVTRLNGQLAVDELPAVEKFAMGGAKSVRGYKENIFVRDSGITFSTQVKFPVYRSSLYMMPFIDYGRSWEYSGSLLAGSAKQLLSAGVGLQWFISKVFRSELFWGYPLKDVEGVVDQQQDGGIHLLLNYKLY